MFASRRVTLNPKSLVPLEVEFERKPKKPHIEVTKLKAPLQSQQRFIIKKEIKANVTPVKPTIVKPTPKFPPHTT
jgi:hypothetical protein